MTTEWSAPKRSESKVHPLDLSQMPPKLQQVVKAVSDANQIPHSFVFMSSVAVLAAATQGRFTVKVNELWTECLSLYVAPLMDSGNRKSPVLKWLVKPIRDYELQLQQTAAPLIRDQESQLRVLEQNLKQCEMKAAKGSPTAEDLAELDAARGAVNTAKVDVRPQLIWDDATPEALTQGLIEQPSCSVLTSEGGLIALLSGDRYSKGTPNIDAVLKAWDSDSITVNRKGAPPLSTEHSHLVLCLGAQPAVWTEARSNDAFTERGLNQRFLVCMPVSKIGHRQLDPSAETIAAAKASERVWQQLVRAITQQPERVLTLTAEASAELLKIRERNESADLPTYEGTLAHGWLSKLPGQIVRLAALLALSEDAHAQTIDGTAMRAAASLYDWLLSEYVNAMDKRGTDPQALILKQLRNMANSKAETRFTTNQLHQSMKGQSWLKPSDNPDVQSPAERIRASLDCLAMDGWVRLVPLPAAMSKPGRPSETWAMHPQLALYYDKLNR